MEKWQFTEEDDDNIAFMWENYAKAMAKRRPESVLEFERFQNYVLQSTTYIVSSGNNAIVGQMNNGVFCPSHFSPAGLKGGIDLIKELRKENVIFAVTPDLGAMLKKLGYKFVFTTKACFRGEEVEKEIFASSYKTVAVYFFKKLFNEVYLKVRKSLKKLSYKIRRAVSSFKVKEETGEEVVVDYASIYGPQN